MNKDKPKRKKKAFSKAVETFILEKMAEGYTIAEMKRKWPDEIPDTKTIYRRSLTDDEWAKKMDTGYTLWYYNKQEELDRLSTGLASEIYPNVEFREAEAALKRRIDALKFSLGKMAPIMSKRFDKVSKVDVSGDNIGPQIQVLNYHVKQIEDTSGQVIDQ